MIASARSKGKYQSGIGRCVEWRWETHAGLFQKPLVRFRWKRWYWGWQYRCTPFSHPLLHPFSFRLRRSYK
jgi:hypothetical protein